VSTLNVNRIADASGGVFAPVSSVHKNRIINGAMTIDQRNAGASVTASTTGAFTYTLDRFAYVASQASKFTIQQNAGSVTPPVGFTNYLGATVGASANVTVGSGDYFSLNQIIEGFNVADLGWGTANAKSVTLSFQVYSSLVGTYGGVLSNNSSYSYPFTYSIPVANTWTTISVTIAGPTSGTWLTTNGVGIRVIFDLGTGSSGQGTAGAWASTAYIGATGATNWISTNSATFYITGVQLEVGTQATSFEYRQYGTELALCQRYYETSYPIGFSAGHNFSQQYPFSTSKPVAINLIASDDTTSSQSVRFVVNKRTSPTVTIYSADDGASGVAFTYKGTGGTALNVSASVIYTSENLWNIGMSLGAINQANESYFHFIASAEL
jgi:hypothetical protein